MSILTDEVTSARQLAESDSGIIYVGTRGEGVVYALTPNESMTEVQVTTVAKNLPMPSGIAIHQGDLYIAALNQILRIKDVDNNLDSPDLELITDSLPSDRHHGWKYLLIDDEGFLYFNVGAPCNTCLSEDERYASILRFDPSNNEFTVHAHGVRNSVGAAWHPVTGEMWFSDNGRDWMGPETPLEEINVITEPGQHFGYPFVHAVGVLDPEFGEGKNPDDYVDPTLLIRAHAAALGMAFYTADHFPSEYSNALFVAEHGSWNHAPGPPRGYRVAVFKNSDGDMLYEPFIASFETAEETGVRGRPNDVLVLSDGSLLISDDALDAVFRVTYSKP